MSRQIAYLNGPRLARAVLAGANCVALNREALDTINVFPVADGDTGTNLVSTLRSVAAAAHHAPHRSVSGVGRLLADAAVDGARGNSGAILASFFSGFAEGLGESEKIDGAGLARAARLGAQTAFEAVQSPRQGTILSVAARWAEGVSRGVERYGEKDIAPVLAHSLAEARRALADTPKEMPLLASAGVVDAGAQGFVDMLEGIDRLIARRGALADMRESLSDLPPPPHLENGGADIRFRYCAEVLVEADGSPLDRQGIRTALSSLGDSLVVAGSKNRLRVHLHTDDVAMFQQCVGSFGRITFRKSDDMKGMNAMAFSRSAQEGVVVISDSTCDLLESDVAEIDRVPLLIRFGPEEYLDGVTLRPEEFADRLKASSHVPTTSQCSPADFRRAYERHLRRGAEIVSIHISSMISGTCQAAQKAAADIDPSKIRVVDSRSTTVGLMLVVNEARRAAAAGKSLEEVEEVARSAAQRIRVYAALSTLKYVVRGGRVTARRARIADFLNIRPIVILSGVNGKILLEGKAFGAAKARLKMVDFAVRELAGRRDVPFAVAHIGNPSGASEVVAAIESRIGIDAASIPVTTASPVLAAHAGPGTVAIAYLVPAE